MARNPESDFLSALPEADVRRLRSCAEERRFQSRESLFRQGDPVLGLFLIRAGTVKLSQIGADGNEVVMRLAGPGRVIAAVGAFAQPERFPVGATALDDVAAWFWPRPLAQELAREAPGFAAALTHEITCQAHTFQQRLRELATERVPQRLAQLLVRLADEAGVQKGGVVRIDVPLTKQDLAQMAGTTLFTVSRQLSEWAEQGLVEVGRASLALRSIEGVRRLAARTGEKS